MTSRLSALGVALCSCTAVLPGNSIGTFRIEGELVSNACAPGYTAPATISYTAELRRSGTIGYFRQTGKPFVQGTLSESNVFQFVAHTTQQVIAPVAAQNIRGCNLVQTETLSGTLTEIVFADGSVDGAAEAGDVSADSGVLDASVRDAGDGGLVSSFVATDKLEFLPEQGSDCSRTLIVNGGGFPALPCLVEYRFTGRWIQ